VSAAGTFSGTTCAAANDYTASCGGNADSPDVAYRLDITHRSDVVIDTCSAGTNFDTVLHLHAGDCTGAEIECDDDWFGCGLSPASSRIVTVLDPGTYYIIVDGFLNISGGAFDLNVSITPVNDLCANSLVLTNGTTTGDTTFATDDPGEACYGADVRGVWYVFRLAQTETVYIDSFGTAWDTVITLKTSCAGPNVICDPVLNDDACGTNQTQFAAILPAGMYFVLVSGYFASSHGPFTLEFQHSPCPGVQPLPASPVAGSTVGHGGDTVGSCAPSTSPDVPYVFTICPGDIDFSFTTCNAGSAYDTVLYLKEGGGGTCGGTEIDCDDDMLGACAAGPLFSEVSATLTDAGLYFIVVDGFGAGSQGNYVLTY